MTVEALLRHQFFRRFFVGAQTELKVAQHTRHQDNGHVYDLRKMEERIVSL